MAKVIRLKPKKKSPSAQQNEPETIIDFINSGSKESKDFLASVAELERVFGTY